MEEFSKKYGRLCMDLGNLYAQSQFLESEIQQKMIEIAKLNDEAGKAKEKEQNERVVEKLKEGP